MDCVDSVIVILSQALAPDDAEIKLIGKLCAAGKLTPDDIAEEIRRSRRVKKLLEELMRRGFNSIPAHILAPAIIRVLNGEPTRTVADDVQAQLQAGADDDDDSGSNPPNFSVPS